MKSRVDLDMKILADLNRVIAKSPTLHKVYESLENKERDAVDDLYLDLVWDIILSAASAKDLDGKPDRSIIASAIQLALHSKSKK